MGKMKKQTFQLNWKKTFLAWALLAAFLLTACAPAPDSASGTGGVSGGDSPADAGGMPDGGQAGGSAAYAPFKTIGTEVTSLMHRSGNSVGFYEVRNNPDGSKNVLFTDYATKQQIVLCGQPNCPHASESCTSWVAPAEQYQEVAVIATEEELFWMVGGSGSARIEKSTLNGSERTLVYEFPSNVSLRGTLAYNGAQLAVMGTGYTGPSGTAGEKGDPEKQNEPITAQSALFIIDVAGGKCTTIQPIDPEGRETNDVSESLFFLGASENGFLMKKITEGVYDFDEATGEIIPTTPTRHTVYKLPYDGSAAQILLEYDQDERFENEFGGDLYSIVGHGDGHFSLERMDGASGETTVIVDDFAAREGGEVIARNDIRGIGFVNILDEYIIIQASESERLTENGSMEDNLQNFAVNTRDGSITPLTLSNYYHVTTVPVEVLAEAGDSLYVVAEVKELPATSAYSMTDVERRRALITKEDYLRSNPNFDYVDMVPRV